MTNRRAKCAQRLLQDRHHLQCGQSITKFVRLQDSSLSQYWCGFGKCHISSVPSSRDCHSTLHNNLLRGIMRKWQGLHRDAPENVRETDQYTLSHSFATIPPWHDRQPCSFHEIGPDVMETDRSKLQPHRDVAPTPARNQLNST